MKNEVKNNKPIPYLPDLQVLFSKIKLLEFLKIEFKNDNPVPRVF